MKPRGHIIKNHDGLPNHDFLKETKTLLAKINGVSGVTDVVSSKIWRSSKRPPLVAVVTNYGENYVDLRYFASGTYQDVTVECDPSSVKRILGVVGKYSQDFAGARSFRRKKYSQAY